MHALSHVSALLGDLAHRRLEPVEEHDEDGVLRVVVPQWDLSALLHVAVEESLEFAGASPAVLRRLAALLRELAWQAPEARWTTPSGPGSNGSAASPRRPPQ